VKKTSHRRLVPLVWTLVLGLSGTALAFHRQTDAVVPITTTGDSDLPRVPAQGRRAMTLAQPDGLFSYLPFITGSGRTLLATTGAQPAAAYDGRTFGWETTADPAGTGLPGWQIVLVRDGVFTAPFPDPSGTSHRPSMDKRARTIAFESDGDLTNVGGPGVRRVYVRDRFATLTLASTGVGWSGNAMVNAKGKYVTFESTSNPATGADTGVRQVWGGAVGLPAGRLTAGAGPSTEPLMSDDGRLVVFSSEADLAGDGHDTNVSQVFAYDTKTQTFARITDEPGGCRRPTAAKVGGDWRITFVCGGQAYYHMLRENVRYHVPTPGGSVQSIVPEMGVHFLTLSTTANLLAGSGSTAGHRIYLVNLTKRPAVAVAGTTTWFPFQGIPGF